jgi:hypothetical protein
VNEAGTSETTTMGRVQCIGHHNNNGCGCGNMVVYNSYAEEEESNDIVERRRRILDDSLVDNLLLAY